jgi:dipeptidyl-peptidase-3
LKICRIFGFQAEKAAKVRQTMWLTMCYIAIKELDAYDPVNKKWLQAHSRGDFVILRVLLEAGQDFIKIEERVGADGKPDLLLTVDYSKIDSVGRPAIAQFLLKLQVYKATGDVESATKMFGGYSEVEQTGPYPFAKWLDIILAKKKPRNLLISSNTFVEGKCYTSSIQTMG